MSDISRSGSALIMPSNQFATHDYEAAKFTVTNGTAAINTNLIGGASGYAEGTTVGTITGNAIVYRNSGGTLQSVQAGGSGLPVTLDTLIAGEDLTNNVTKVEERFSYYNHVGTAGSTSGTVKSGAGFLHCVSFNKHTTAGTYTLYDSVGTSATVIATISSDGAAVPTLYDVSFTTGLTVVSGSVCNLTFSYR